MRSNNFHSGEHKDLFKTNKKTLIRENHVNNEKWHYVLDYNLQDKYSPEEVVHLINEELGISDYIPAM